MALRTEEELEGCEVALVFIARNTSEATRVENLLTDRGVDYTISLEPFLGSSMALLFGGKHPLGAFFWVVSEKAVDVRNLLEDHGLRAGIVEPEPG